MDYTIKYLLSYPFPIFLETEKGKEKKKQTPKKKIVSS